MSNVAQMASIIKPSRTRRTNSTAFRKMGTTADVLFAAAAYLDTEGEHFAAHLLHKKATALLARRSAVIDAKYRAAESRN